MRSEVSAALAAAILLTACCGQASGPAQGASATAARSDTFPKPEELSTIVQAGYKGLLKGEGHFPCGNYYDVGPAKILDWRVSGDTAEVDAIIPVTALMDIEDRHMASTCFYKTAWSAGQRYNIKVKAHLERWSSGWRLVNS